MADNIVLNSGSGGATLAADDITSVWYQISKLAFGALNTATLVTTSAPLPVDIRAENAVVSVDDNAGSLTIDNAALSVTGGGVEASALRVTIASDSTGVVSIDDNGGSITIDNTNIDNLHSEDFDTGVGTDTTSAVGIAVPASGGAAVVPGDATAGLKVDLGADNDVTVTGTVTVDNAGTFAVQVDGDALTALQLIDDPVATLGTTTYTEASTKGMILGVVRNDALAALADTDNEIAPLQVNASGALYIQEGAALDVSAATVTVDLGANNDVTIDNSSIVKAEDAVHGSGDAGVMALAVRNDTLAALAGTDGDYAPLQVNASGALYIQEGAALDVSAATVTVDLGANNDVTIDNSSIVQAEDAVHGTGDAGVMALAVRDTSPAAVSGTDGDYEPLHVSDDGGLWVSLVPSHTGGHSGFTSVDLDESEEQVSATACKVAYMYFWNTTAGILWAQLFNATAASVTVGTTAPDLNFAIPANADSDGAGVTIPLPDGGLEFGTALTVAVTGAAGTDATDPGASAAGCLIAYKN